MNRKERRLHGEIVSSGGKKTFRSKNAKKKSEQLKKAGELGEAEEIQLLEQRIAEESPAPGTQGKSDGVLRFDSLPLSRRTLQGLAQAKMEIATDIQAAAIPHALAGRDILGAAKTGSGKTLAFLVPLLEKLFRERWTTEDGLAAIVITPTRELALQIFEVLRLVGKKHQFSAGLVTGGKKEFAGEQERIIGMNILVATPGRLLQHFEQTSGFDASQLQMLVLDEADRILDLGFKQQLDAVLSYLPTHRQTMLFSATQTKSVKDLARLSLQSPQYLAVHAEDKEVTPTQLVQNYIVVPLHEKLDVLFNFLKTHMQSKMIVFFSTCSPVRFVHELFRSLKPGVPLTALHGKVKQDRRTLIYMDFLKRPSACMFATDIAARGLDFPNVDWVVQCDAPEDGAMYIHRVGRTARYNANGRALLMLMPQEEASVVKMLEKATIPVKKLTLNPNKQQFSIASKAAALLAAYPDYRNYAKKAFTGYLRSLLLLPVCPLRDLTVLPTNEFATSLGLPFTPPLPASPAAAAGLQSDEAREELREKKNVNRALDKLKKQIKEAKEAKKKARAEAKKSGTVYLSESSEDEEELLEGDMKKKEKKKLKSLSNAIPKVRADDDEEDDFLQVKQVHDWSGDKENDEEAKEEQEERAALATTDSSAVAVPAKPVKMKINKEGKLKVKGAAGPTKKVFDEDGNLVEDSFVLQPMRDAADEDEVKARIERYAQQVKSKVDQGRDEDIMREKQRLRDLRMKRKATLKGDEAGEAEEAIVTLGRTEESESENDNNSDDNESDSERDDDDTSDDDESDDESRGRKRQRESSDDDESDDSEDSDDDDDSQAVDINAIKDQERLALEILEGKRQRTR